MHEDAGPEESGVSAKVAGDFICEIFPLIDMAKEAQLLPPILLPVILLIDVGFFPGVGWLVDGTLCVLVDSSGIPGIRDFAWRVEDGGWGHGGGVWCRVIDRMRLRCRGAMARLAQACVYHDAQKAPRTSGSWWP